MPQRMLKKAASGLAGRHWIIALASVRCASEGLLLVGLPLKLTALGWSDWELGLRAGLSAGVYAVTCLLTSSVVHRLPARAMMMLSSVASAAVVLGLALADEKWLLYALSALFSFATSFFWVPLMAWIGESQDEHLVGDMAAFNCSWMGALAIGTLVGGRAEAAVEGLALYLVMAVLLVVAVLAPFARIRGQQAARGSATASATVPRRFLVTGWVVAFFAMLSVSVPMAVFVKLSAELGYGQADYGDFWTVQSVGRVAIVLLMANFQGWRRRRWPLVGALLLAASGGVALATALSRMAFAGGFVLLGLGAGMGYMLGFYYSVHGRLRRKRNAALFEAMIVSQAVIGGPLGGIVATHFGRRAPYAVTAALALLAAVLLVLWLRRPAGTKAG